MALVCQPHFGQSRGSQTAALEWVLVQRKQMSSLSFEKLFVRLESPSFLHSTYRVFLLLQWNREFVEPFLGAGSLLVLGLSSWFCQLSLRLSSWLSPLCRSLSCSELHLSIQSCRAHLQTTNTFLPTRWKRVKHSSKPCRLYLRHELRPFVQKILDLNPTVLGVHEGAGLLPRSSSKRHPTEQRNDATTWKSQNSFSLYGPISSSRCPSPLCRIHQGHLLQTIPLNGPFHALPGHSLPPNHHFGTNH